MRIELYTGEREALRALLELADERGPLALYMHKGEVLAAREDDEVVGVALIAPVEAEAIEIKNLAVRADRQGTGIGRALIEACIAACKARGVRRLLVATAAADVNNLRFYQRTGFRMLRIRCAIRFGSIRKSDQRMVVLIRPVAPVLIIVALAQSS